MKILPEGTGRAFAKFFRKYFLVALVVFLLAFFLSLPHLHGTAQHRYLLATGIALAADAAVAFVAVIIGFAASLKGLS